MDGKELPVSGPYNPFLSNREINRLSFNGAEGHLNRLLYNPPLPNAPTPNVPISEDERKLYSEWGEALKKGGKSKRRRQNKSKRRRRRSRRQRKA
jgi:hypothetical protein